MQPVVVQGTVVNQSQQKYNNQSSYVPPINTGGADFNGVKGEAQPIQYQDVSFAVIFYVHLAVMLALLVMYGGAGNNGGGGGGANYASVAACVSVCGVFAFVLSGLMLGFMMKFAREMVKAALIFSIVNSLMMGIFGAMAGQMLMAGLGLLGFVLGICYAYFVWDRIPFAAANLNTALTGVRSNLGLALVAYFFLGLAFVWSIWWSVASAGTMNSLGQGAMFLFLVSYFWVHQVLQNTITVTTAGTIGTWWFTPLEADSFLSSAIRDSFTRATTYSFGSICFGSLLVAIVQALRHMNNMARDQEDCNMLVCVIDCILGCIEGMLEYLNKWAYVYVGLYGYSYLEAGKNVMTLFEHKGWTAIITDDLVDNVLFMVSIGVGLITGLVGLIYGEADKTVAYTFGSENYGLVGFIIGFVVGFVLSSILMRVVGGAVDTVIVLYAEAPNEFQTNHTELSNEMRDTWRQAFPVECGNY